jgi:hypothetical protein
MLHTMYSIHTLQYSVYLVPFLLPTYLHLHRTRNWSPVGPLAQRHPHQVPSFGKLAGTQKKKKKRKKKKKKKRKELFSAEYHQFPDEAAMIAVVRESQITRSYIVCLDLYAEMNTEPNLKFSLFLRASRLFYWLRKENIDYDDVLRFLWHAPPPFPFFFFLLFKRLRPTNAYLPITLFLSGTCEKSCLPPYLGS